MRENIEFGQLSHETLLQIPHLALFIDNVNSDHRGFYSWDRCLSKLGCRIIWLGTPKSCIDLTKRIDSFGPKIELVIADQFHGDERDGFDMIWPCLYLLQRLRQSNPHTWIIETSYSPTVSRYPGVNTNSIMDSIDDPDKLQAEIVKIAKMMPNAPLPMIFSYACNVYGLLAQDVETEKCAVNYYYDRLFTNTRLPQLFELLEITSEQFYQYYKPLSEHLKRAFLHHCFQILSHLDANRDGNYYSMPLGRLRSMIDQIDKWR